MSGWRWLHRYNHEALRSAWESTPSASSGEVFWSAVAAKYSRLVGVRVPWPRLQKTAYKRGMFARTPRARL